MSQAAFERYVEPARHRAGLLRLLVGLLLIVLGWLVWTAAVMAAWVGWRISAGASIPEATELLGTEFLSADPLSISLMLLTFFGIWPSTWAVVRLLHQRSFGTLLSPERRFRWEEFGLGLVLAALLFASATLVGTAVVGLPERSALSLTSWAVWLVPLALAVFVQSAGEELIFRGYLLQQLAARARSPLIWGVAPALLFGLAHVSPAQEPAMNLIYVATTLVFGLTAALLVWRTGAIAAAMGLHAGNNFGAICVTGLESVASGSQLWVHSASAKETLVLIDLAMMSLLLLWLVSPACPRGLRAAG